MPLDHACVSVPRDRYEEVVTWYLKALEPLGYTKQQDFPGHACGLGDPHADFWLGAQDGTAGTLWIHYAFRTKTREEVRKFYDAAIAAGGKDNGKPGIRTMYHPNYYGAFVFDPLGNNIEAVCHLPEEQAGQ